MAWAIKRRVSLMFNSVGSRGYETINYHDTCLLSGVTNKLPLHYFALNKLVILRSDFIKFCQEYLSYKIGLTEYSKDIGIIWIADNERYPTRVYRKDIRDDYDSTIRVLSVFHNNFLKSDVEKVKY